MRLLIITFVTYLIGSVPFGYVAGRLAGVDIRSHGSGNIGATNVLRTLGKRYGYAVFLADLLKGLAAVRLGLWAFAGEPARTYLAGVLAAVCVVLGHSFPVWLRFRGGKGVATSAGACLGLMPLEAFVAGAVWLAIFALFRFVSLASITAAGVLPLAVWLLTSGQARGRALLLSFSIVIALVVILRHRSNITRLFRGTEPRFQRK